MNRTYRGDIETIVAKALEKDKARRYASAAEFGADIRRCLMDEPIVARPPTTSYQLGKFARRHKALVAGVAAVFVVLAIGVVVSRQQAVRAKRAENAAVEEKGRAEQSAQSERAARSAETQQRQLAEAARIQADEQKVLAQHALSAAERNLYFNNIDLADRESMAANIGHGSNWHSVATDQARNRSGRFHENRKCDIGPGTRNAQ